MNRFLQSIFIASILNILFVFGLSAQCLTEGGTIVSTTIPASCNGASDGVLKVTFTDGIYAYSSYTYSLIDKFTSQPVSVPYGSAVGTLSGSTLTFTGVPAGLYIVQAVRPSPGKCLVNIRFLTGIAVDEPDSLNVSLVSTTAACSGGNSGSIDISVSGGNAPYTYAWTGGLPTQQDHSGTVAAGSYDVTVTDAKGCTGTLTGITVAPQPTATLSGDNTICSGSNTTLSFALTGTAPWQVTYMTNGGNPVTLSGIATSPFTVSVSPTTNATYTLQSVRDNNCTTGVISGSANVTVNPLPTATITAGGPTTFCSGGSVTLTASAAVSYLWSTSLTTQSITVSAAGSYTVTVTDVNGCSATSSATTVTVNPLPVLVITNPAAVCSPSTVNLTGSAVTAGSTGGGTLTYYPTMADAMASTNALASASAVATSGTYFIKSTTGAGCSDIKSVTVTINPLPATPIITASGPTTFCSGGSVTLTSSSATGNMWSNNATTQSITVSTAGNYTVTVTDANSCSATSAATTVTVNPLPTPIITAGGPTTFCSGGSVTLTASAASSYLWSTGLTTQSITVSTAGSYTVTVTDANSCSATSAATTVTVNPLPTPIITAGGPTTFCSGGSVTLTASAASSYLWSTGLTTQSITVSTAGSYTVTVTDANSCSATSAATTVTVNPLPATPVITAGGPTTFCNGGSVTLTASAASSYLWSTGLTTQSITVSTAGSYTVTVTDANSCSANSAATTVTINPLPVLVITNPAAVCSPSTVNLTGSAVTAGSTGGGTLTYYPTMADAMASTNALASASAVATSGTYFIKSTTGAGCSDIKSVTVTINPLPATPTITAGGPTTFCSGGSVTLTASAASSYLWSTGLTTQAITVSTAGSYTVTVTDANGCSATSAATTVTVNPLPVLVITNPAAVCSPATVNLTAAAVTAGSTGGGTLTYYPTIADAAAGTNALASASAVATSGTYFIKSTTGAGCSDIKSVTVTINPLPATPIITASGPTTFCSGGSVTLTASAASSYLWSTGVTTQSITVSAAGSYTVTVTDANGCSATSVATTITVNPLPTPIITAGGPTTFCSGGSVILTASAATSYAWSTGANTQAITVSAAGSYTVTVTDANGCSANSAATTVTVNPLPVLVITNPAAVCSPATVNLTAAAVTAGSTVGGTLTYYPTMADATASTNALASASAVATSGTYFIKSTTGAGCSDIKSVTVTINPLPATPIITAGGPTTFCSGGSVTLTASAASSYLWSTGFTTQSITVSTAGSYTVTVTDANGCSATSVATTITVNPLPTPIITAGGPTTFCSGGSVILTASAATSYAWSTGANTQAITVSAAGSYTVTVTDANGCSATSAATTITVNPLPVLVITNPAAVCSPATVNLTAAAVTAGSTVGGTLTYYPTMADATASTNALASASAVATSGTYFIKSTTGAGCSDIKSVTVTINPLPATPTITAGGPTTFCSGGSVTLTASAASSYLWSTGLTTQSITVSTAGSYTVTVTDGNGCSATSAATTITVNPLPVLVITNPAAVCSPSTVNLTATAVTAGSTGAGTLTYYASMADATASTNALTSASAVATSGTYYIKSTTGAGCTDIKPVTVTINPLPATPTLAAFAPVCSDVATVTLSGGTPTGGVYSGTGVSLVGSNYVFTTSAGTQTITYTVTNGGGCSSSTSATLTVTPAPVASFSYPGSPFCASDLNALPSFANGSQTGGTFSSGSAQLVVNATTGEVDLVNSTAGTYTVTYTVTANGCTTVVTSSVVINVSPKANFSYPGTPYCINAGTNPLPAFSGGGVAGTFSSTAELSINPGTGEVTLASSSAGTYTVTNTVTANGCTTSATATITINAAPTVPTITASGATTFCQGDSVTLTSNSASGNQWNLNNTAISGATGSTLVVSATGSYTVTVTDGNSCSATSAATTGTVSPAPSAPTVTSPLAYCQGAGATALTAAGTNLTWYTTATGGTGVATITPSTNTLGSTDFYVSQTVGTCESPRTKLTVTVNPVPVLSITDPGAVCSPATVDLTAAAVTAGSTGGGTLSYWTDAAATTALASPTQVVTSGTYYIQSTVSGCSDIQAVKVTINSITLTAVVSNSTSCTTANGSINLTATGTGLTYAWSDGAGFTASTEDISGLSAGTYTVIVTDAGGCTATLSRTITSSTTLVVSATVGNSTSCIAPNGSITLAVSGGTTPYTYSWSNGAGFNVATKDISGLSAGTYTVIVTDASGCTSTTSGTITDPSGITLSISSLNVTDCAAPDGAVAVSVSGGKAPYTYLWNTGATTQTLSSLTAGIYSVLVTDNNGCTATLSKTITDPDAIVLSNTVVNSSSCANPTGSITATVTSGGVAPFTYLWNNGSTAATISNLSAGTYSVTVTDANNCKATISSIVADPAAIVLSAGTTNSTNCTTPNGKIDLSIISGGQAPFTYLWNNGATTQNLANIPAGVYTVVVKDAAGCQATLTRAIGDPAGIGLSAIAQNVTGCTTANGSITLTVTGGNGTLTYLWSNAATAKDISNLSAGTYTVTVKDANGCQATLSQTITSPAAIALTAVVTDGSGCTAGNGAIDLTVTGGKAPYTYNWNNGTYTTQDLTNLISGTYTVVVSDQNGCTATLSRTITSPVALLVTANATNSTDCKVPNGKVTLTVSGGTAPYTYLWNTTSTQDSLTGLAAGTYSVTVTDATGCSAFETVNIQDPANIQLTSTVVNSTDCTSPNGEISLTITGGLGPYTYLWNDNSTLSTLKGLSAGTYTVIVTDAGGCTATEVVAVTDPCTPPTCTLAVTATPTNSSNCTSPDGEVELNVTGGTTPFTYAWSNGTGFASPEKNISGLVSGTYTVVVTDSKGCVATTSATITDPAAITLTTVVTNVSDCKVPNGAINLTVAGGTAPYTVLWNNNATAEDLTKLSAGTYVVTVTDATGCSAALSVKVQDPAGMLLAASASNSTDCANPDGSITVSVMGGLAPYTHQWATGETTSALSNLSAGTYSVTVTDANGCTATLATQITDPSGMSLTANVTNSTSCTVPNGSIALSINGGVTPYSYAWSNGAGFTFNESDLTGLAAGTYTVVITDGDQCKATLTRTISDPGAITLSATSTNLTSCTTPNGSITLTATGTGLTYAWSNGATTKDISGLAAGTYTVVVKNASGCQATLSRTITNPTGPAVPTATSPVAYCQGASASALTATPSTGGTLQWYTAATGGTASALAPTPSTTTVGTVNYYVSQLVNGCESARTVIAVNVTATSPAPVASSPAAVCAGSAIPTLTATGTALKWYKDAGLTTQLGTNFPFTPNSADIDMNVAGTTTFYVTQDIGCGESVATAVTVTVKATNDPSCTPTCTLAANAGANQSVCALTTNLSATALTGSATGVWSKVSGAGSVSFGTASSATSSITVDQAGTYVLRWLVTEGTCTASDSVMITFNTTSPAPVASSPAALCIGSAIPSLTATGTNLNWYKDAGLTTQLGTGASFTPNSADLNMSAAGTTTFYVTQTTACGQSVATAVAVNVTATSPAPTASSPITVCQNGAIPTLSATGTSLKWYSNAALSTQVGTGASFTPSTSQLNMTVVGNTTFFVTQDIGCGESAATQVVVTVSPTSPAPTATSPTALCAGSAIPSLSATGTALKWYKEAGLTTQLGTNSPFTPNSADIDMNVAGTTTFYVTQDIGCGESVATAVTVTVKAANDPSCTPTCTLAATAVATNSTNCTAPDGEINLTVTDGASPFTYSWSNGSIDEDLSGLAAGTYTVTVTDAKGCKTTASATVKDPAAIVLTTVITDATTSTPPNGAIDLIITGGKAPYTILWSNGATMEDLTNLSAGTYTVIVVDGNGCQATASAIVKDPAGMILAASASNSTNCTTPNGSISVSVTGGVAPYTYQWATGEKTSTLSGLSAGTYSVTVTDANGFTSTLNTQITDPSGMSLTAVLDNSTSCTTPNGSIILSVSSGVAPYTYAWSNGITTKDISGLAAGTYTVIVTDKNNCKATLARTISDTSAITLAATSTNPTSCVTPNGSITLTATGSGLTYAWSNGASFTATTKDITGLAAGTYTVIVKNASGCQATLSRTITNPTGPAAPTVTTLVAYCQNAAPTALMATPSTGGTLQWYTVATGGTASASAPTPSTTTVGTVNYYVSQVLNGCESARNLIAVNVTGGLPASVAITATADTACANTAITFTATSTNGGSAPTYSWLINGVGTGATGTIFISSTLKNGDVVRVVMTAAGSGTSCITGSPAVSNPITITISSSLTASVSIAASQTTACPNTAITFTATVKDAGSAPTYQWQVNEVDVPNATSANFTTSSLINTNRVRVVVKTGGSGTSCITNTTATSSPITMTISNNIQPTVSISASATGPFCSGSSVSFTATVTNAGVAPKYEWRVGTTVVATTATFASTTLNNNDVVTVKITPDVSGTGSCINPAVVTSNQVTVTIKPSTDPTCNCTFKAVAFSTPVTCQGDNDGVAVAIVSNATGKQFSYSLNGGPAVSVDSLIKEFSNQPFGPYEIKVTDRNNTLCSATATGNIGALVTLVAQVSYNNPTCGASDGRIDFDAFKTGNGGGKAPYNISIDGGKTFTSTATGDITFDNLAAGTYNIVISDGTPCTTTLSITLKASGTTSPAPVASSPAAVCSGSAIPTLAATGTALNWYGTPALGTSLSTSANFTPTAAQLNMNVAGTTTFYVTQDLGCGESAATAVAVTVKAVNDPTCTNPPVCTLTANAGANQSVCPLTSTLAATVPTGSATGVWSKVSGVGSVSFGTASSATSSITVDQVGTYVLRWLVTEGTCSASDSVTITFNTISPAPVASSPAALCIGSAIPTLTATGTALKWYKDAGLTTQLGTGASFTPASADIDMSVVGTTTFYVTQTTACGVSAATAVAVNVTGGLPASVAITATADTACANTAITFTATSTNGGSAPTYSWLINGVGTGATGTIFISSTLKNGDVVRVVMTAAGSGTSCITGSPAVSNPITITISSSLTASVSIAASQTTACPNTAITFTATVKDAGSAPTYQWQVNEVDVPNATSANFTTSSLINTNRVRVVVKTGGSGTSCITNTTATSSPITMTISNNIQPTVSISASATGPFCSGSSVSFTATVTNAGVAPKYEWRVGTTVVATTATFASTILTNNDVVSLSVTADASGANSCISQTPVSSNAVTVSIKPSTDPSCGCDFQAKAYSNPVTCQGDSDGEAFAIVLKGGSGQFSYSLNGGPAVSADAVFQEFINQPQGTFTIKITDLNNTNCFKIVSDSIPAYVTLVTPVKYNDPTCKGNDGKIDFDAFKTGNGGGNAPFNISIDGGKTFTQTATGDLTFSNLTAGTYNIVISDGTPCTTSFSIKLDNSALITPNVAITTANSTVCASTSTTFTATPTNGGTAPKYRWKINGVFVTGDTTGVYASSTLKTGDVVSVEMTADASGTTCVSSTAVASNNISVTVKPANDPTCNCIIAAVAKSDVSCNGQNDGTISIGGVSGGDAATYQYSISGPVNDTGKQLFTGLKPGIYTVVVKDGQGTCQFSLAATIVEPTKQSLVLVVTDPATVCAPGKVDLTAATVTAGSSTGTLSYWMDDTAVTPIATPTAISASGTYFIKSSNGVCSSVQPVKVVINAAPSLVISNPTGDCANPVVDLTAATVTAGSTGGTFTYWTNASATTPIATPNAVMVSGTYYIKSTNASGCFDIKPVVVTTSPSFEVRITTEAGCSEKGGVALLENIKGGKGPYRYSLNDVSYMQIDSTNSISIPNLASGSYTMYVKDSDQRKLCAQTFVIEGAKPITYTVNTVNIACSDENIGSILLKNIKGGTLSTGAASSIIAGIDDGNGFVYQDVVGDSIQFSNLAAGEYTIVLNYGRSLTCSTLPKVVTITRSSVLFTVETKAATCGEANGLATAVVVGKSEGYSYSLAPTTGFRASPSFDELKPGTYTMYIRTGETDLCPNQKMFKILGPDQLTYTFDKNNSCEGAQLGNVTFEIKGGVMPYKISSDNGATFTDDIYESRYVYLGQKTRDTGLKPGDYQFVIKDVRGCTTLPVPVKIEESRIRARIRVEASKVEEPTGQILVYDLRGGTPTYQVSVDGQHFGEVHSAKLDTLITGLAIGSYNLTVRDENNCDKLFPFVIKESKFEIPNIFTPNGDTYNDVFQINNLPDGSYVTITSRWGKVVYTSSNYQNDWDGAGLSDGIYFYSVNVPTKGVFKGWVEIKREYP